MFDPRILGALLKAPSCLSGLSDMEFNVVRERACAALHPELAQMQQWLTKALEELREGIAARSALARAVRDGRGRQWSVLHDIDCNFVLS